MKTIFEGFKEILAALNLQDNIIGYNCCLTLLCFMLMVKILTLCLVFRKLKSCKRVSDLEQLEIMKI